MATKQISFYFDMYPERHFVGYAAGGTWNGFDNVKITPQVASAIDAFFHAADGIDIDERISEIPRDGDGLIDLSNGYATVIVS